MWKSWKKSVKRASPDREQSFLGLNIPIHIIPSDARPFQGSKTAQHRSDKAKKAPPKTASTNIHQQRLQELVGGYLHPTPYGRPTLVPHGFAPAACPCCLDRNAENMVRMTRTLPLPVSLPSPSPNSVIKPVINPDLGTTIPDGSHRNQEQGQPTNGWHGDSVRAMDHQPAPYSRDIYLSPTANRIWSLQSQEECRRKMHDEAQREYVSQSVREADSKFDLAMSKLRRSLRNDFA